MDWSENIGARQNPPILPYPGLNASYSPGKPRSPYYSQYLLPPGAATDRGDAGPSNSASPPVSDRSSYYLSTLPLYVSDWATLAEFETECVALGSYKEGFTNNLQIVHGIKYGKEATHEDTESPTAVHFGDDSIEGFDFHKVAEINVDYPITKLQWDPMMNKTGHGLVERLAASSESLRLYQVDHDQLDANNNYLVTQTHNLCNSTGGNSDVNTLPPVTSFDWNKVDNSIIIASSVDTTCTVWDLNRALSVEKGDSAQVKTQLIAHDSEVFDVKFLHESTNLFASVGNDGSMRVFDLRSLEHSTIIYEPPANVAAASNSGHYNSKALLKLAASNIDQNYLATVGVNSNQIIIIDTRMPGVPVCILDGSFGGANATAINSIQWHPNSNFLLTGGDDCQALIWDCNNLYQSLKPHSEPAVVDCPVLQYEETLEINNVCWRGASGDWLGVVSGKGFQTMSI